MVKGAVREGATILGNHGGKIEWANIATDALGTAIGNAIAASIGVVQDARRNQNEKTKQDNPQYTYATNPNGSLRVTGYSYPPASAPLPGLGGAPMENTPLPGLGGAPLPNTPANAGSGGLFGGAALISAFLPQAAALHNALNPAANEDLAGLPDPTSNDGPPIGAGMVGNTNASTTPNMMMEVDPLGNPTGRMVPVPDTGAVSDPVGGAVVDAVKHPGSIVTGGLKWAWNLVPSAINSLIMSGAGEAAAITAESGRFDLVDDTLNGGQGAMKAVNDKLALSYDTPAERGTAIALDVAAVLAAGAGLVRGGISLISELRASGEIATAGAGSLRTLEDVTAANNGSTDIVEGRVKFGLSRGGGGSELDRAYAEQVTGTRNSVYVNDVEFDGAQGKTLIDAKRASGPGSFYDISGNDSFTQEVKIPTILEQANRQVNALNGISLYNNIEWVVADPTIAQQLGNLLTDVGLPITVRHQAFNLAPQMEIRSPAQAFFGVTPQ